MQSACSQVKRALFFTTIASTTHTHTRVAKARIETLAVLGMCSERGGGSTLFMKDSGILHWDQNLRFPWDEPFFPPSIQFSC
jgi:hypothetical protein